MAQEETNRGEPWYEVVASSTSLTQGDIILQCPLIGWKAGPLRLEGSGESVTLQTATNFFVDDVVVMTQACDLENNKVSNVVLCPCTPLTRFREAWEAERRQSGAQDRPSRLSPLKDGRTSFCPCWTYFLEGSALRAARVMPPEE